MINFFKERFTKIKESHIDIKGFLLSPLILLIALEIMHLTYGLSIIKFFAGGSIFMKLFLSYMFLLGIESGLLVFIPKISVVNALMTTVFYVLGLANEVICTLTGDPLLPTDLLLLKNLGNIASFVKIPFSVSKAISLIVCLFSIFWFFFRGRKREKLKVSIRTRLIITVLAGVYCFSSIYLTCINRSFRHEFMKNHNIQIAAFDPKSDYMANGVILTFFPRIGDIIVEKPENYSEQNIKELKEKYTIEDKKANKIQPNVIAIQNEAWWDPALLPDVKFSKDPLPNLRKLSKEGKGGYLVSPVFAGGTCMPEFEFLTGFTTKFLPTSVYPYIQSITSPTESLASIFEQNGYESIAFHTYKKNFYGRNKAYPLMGFEDFISVDDLDNPEMKGWYVSDMQMTNDIIKMYENKKKDKFFLFGISMQNHGDYAKKRYESYDIEVTSDTLSNKDLQGLKDYTQGAYDADIALNELVNYFRQISEPTLIIMYGDHLPLLGTDGSTYSDGGFIEKQSVFQSYKFEQLYKTPYVVWANYDISKYDFPKEISAGNLGLKTAEMSSLNNMPWYFSFLRKYYDKYPVYENSVIKDKDFKTIFDVSEEDREIQKEFELIEYDIINGKQYGK